MLLDFSTQIFVHLGISTNYQNFVSELRLYQEVEAAFQTQPIICFLICFPHRWNMADSSLVWIELTEARTAIACSKSEG